MLYTLRGVLEICYQESADRIEGPHPHILARNQEEIAAGFCVKVRKQEPPPRASGQAKGQKHILGYFKVSC